MSPFQWRFRLVPALALPALISISMLNASFAADSDIFSVEEFPRALAEPETAIPASIFETGSDLAFDSHSCCQSCPVCAPASGPDPLLGDFGRDYVDGIFERALGWKNEKKIPIGFGAWHWYHEDLSGSNDGYGIEGLRGTYWWFITADPEYDLGGGEKVGGHLEYRLRDGDNFRSFFDSKFWSYEAYGYYSNEDIGTLKAGQIWKRFGLDWDGVFFGNVPYFDGFKLDPDYGLSWEKTWDNGCGFKIDSFVQFFFHEDGVNGSFEGADAESVPGIHERNTGVIRLIPTWTFCDESTLAVGISGLAGEIDSDRPDIPHENVGAWAVDATYTRGPWKMFGEVLQSYGRINPARFVSGGPSNKLTDFLAGVHYTRGPVTYRASYSLGIDDNPHAEHNMVVAGTTIKMTDNVDFYIEYINEQVSGNAQTDYIEFFNSLDFIVYWKY